MDGFLPRTRFVRRSSGESRLGPAAPDGHERAASSGSRVLEQPDPLRSRHGTNRHCTCPRQRQRTSECAITARARAIWPRTVDWGRPRASAISA